MDDEEVVAAVERFDEGLCGSGSGNGKVGFDSAVCAVAAGEAESTAAMAVSVEEEVVTEDVEV
jgi:hypothetical protein